MCGMNFNVKRHSLSIPHISCLSVRCTSRLCTALHCSSSLSFHLVTTPLPPFLWQSGNSIEDKEGDGGEDADSDEDRQFATYEDLVNCLRGLESAVRDDKQFLLFAHFHFDFEGTKYEGGDSGDQVSKTEGAWVSLYFFRKHIEDPTWRQWFADDLLGNPVTIPGAKAFYADTELLKE